jgi:hypothetical protein
VLLKWQKNIDLGSFDFLCTKNSFFILLAPKMSFFVKHLPSMSCKNVPLKFLKIIYHIVCTIHQLFALKKILATPQKIDKILPI